MSFHCPDFTVTTVTFFHCSSGNKANRGQVASQQSQSVQSASPSLRAAARCIELSVAPSPIWAGEEELKFPLRSYFRKL